MKMVQSNDYVNWHEKPHNLRVIVGTGRTWFSPQAFLNEFCNPEQYIHQPVVGFLTCEVRCLT